MQEVCTEQDDISHAKHCPRCDKWLPSGNFSFDKKTKSNLFHICKECHNKYKKARMTPEKQREYSLRTKFNITTKQYDQMFANQGGVCASCKQPETQINERTKMLRSLAVDHNHKTGDVRALLCSKCNIAFGFLDENPFRIKALLDYAEWCQSQNPDTKIVQIPLLNNDDTVALINAWKGEENLNNDLKENVDTYIPVKQVAKEISANKDFILQEIRSGHLEAYMLAGGYKIKRSTLDAYIEARKVQPVK